jgi:hypothetical protein
VKTSESASTSPSVVSSLATGTVTSAVGAERRRRLIVTVEPLSAVAPDGGPAKMPAVSLSRFVIGIGSTAISAYFSSADSVGPTTTWKSTGPSSTRSSCPVTMTVCGALKLSSVNVIDAGETVPSPLLSELRSRVTSADGFDRSTI